MKAQSKTKIIRPKKTSKRPRPVSRSVKVAHLKHPLLRHFRLLGYEHTGKLLHHRHTSHLSLVIILIIVGFLLFMSDTVAQARIETVEGSISVGAIVPGPAPTVGAVILNPTNGTNLIDIYTTEVSGTCLKQTFVVVKDNGRLAGSTICTDANIFILDIQLVLGNNALSALNYDNLNQPGPDTPTVTVIVKKSVPPVIVPEPIVPEPTVPEPVIPDNPAIIPGLDNDISDCEDYKVGELPVGGEPHIEIVCVPRFFGPNIEQSLGFIIWGGTPPYAVNINWGSGKGDELLSISSQGYRTVRFNYSVAGVYNIALEMKDEEGQTAIVQTAVQVSGKIEEVKTFFASIADDIAKTEWFKTPVPLYLMAVAITLGFWGGDIFDRKFGASRFSSKSRRAI